MNVPKIRFNEFKNDYISKKLCDISELTSSKRIYLSDYVDNGIPFYRGKEITELKANKDVSDLLYITEEKYNEIKNKYGVPEENDILITGVGTLGNIYRVPNNDPFYFKDGNLIWLKHVKENSKYLEYNLEKNKKKILDSAIGSTQKALTIVGLSKLDFNFPSLNEQTKVSNFLSLIDKKIELQSKKIEDLKLFKSYAKNQLFSSGEKVVKLKDILIKWNERNKDGSIDYVESISNKYGFISQSDQFEDRNVASKDLKNYYVIKKNVFGYNPSRLNVGSLALKENDNTSVVSPLYECFTTTQNNKFMLEWFDSKYFKKGTLSKFEGGVRNTLNFTNLCEIEINLPTLDKQNEFANYLYNFDKKIQLEELKLNKLNEIKKGLMQSMFV